MAACRFAAILVLIEPEIAPFDRPTPKTPPRPKHKVYPMTRCGDIAIRNFPNEKSVGRWSVGSFSIHALLSYIILLFTTLGT